MKGYNFSGYKRLTFGYQLGWRGEDHHEYVGEFHVLNRRHTPPTNYEAGYGDDGLDTITVRAPRGVSREDVAAALVSEFSNACRHEHDCCGCLITRAGTPQRVKQRNWVVPVSRSFNV